MLKLIQIEFLKLRRRKFIWLMLLAALFMPLAAVFYFASVKGTGVEPIEFYKWTAFSYTPWIILPVVLGMLCTMLMYNENQYDILDCSPAAVTLLLQRAFHRLRSFLAE